MSFLSDFEGRISSVFGAAPQGYTEPFSFKRLAKQAAREMESETYEIDGVDTAPALYTVLVSATDDALMRPLYEQITYETSAFVTAQAQKKGYSFVGNPLVRFMVDPSLRSGKFNVFAENVDVSTLERLREEERAFLGGNSSVGGAAAQVHPRGVTPAPAPVARHEEVQPIQPLTQPVERELFAVAAPQSPVDTDAGLSAMPDDYGGFTPVASASGSTPMPVVGAATPVIAPVVEAGAAVAVPQTKRRNVPLVDVRRGVGVSVPEVPAAQPVAAHAPGPSAAPGAVSAMLVYRSTGQTFPVCAPVTVVGRERSQANVVLRDPNVSRRHAEIFRDGQGWHIRDLNSTNGTLVNDVDVTECSLRNGDLITVGLVNLEFRENLQ